MNDAGRFSALTLEAVERRYGRGETTVEVLSGASLALYSGQSVALIAPSGAGKSTLLHLAGLLERPNAGEVTVAGKATSIMTDEERTALRRNQIGFVYQFHHLLPEFSALENLVLPQMIAGLARAEAEIAEQLPRAACRLRAGKPRDHLRQDEVLERGKFRQEVMELVDEADLAAAQRGALIVTHGRGRDAAYRHFARVRPLEQARDMQERRFSRPRGGDQRHRLARIE
ncbi:MAG: ATP-binding cassette domain-containing protein, partial [Hyphomicrobiales bacterium]|nr:ATP-binding cassette domain-containing protein [Hyphomicrobiales bacterium]